MVTLNCDNGSITLFIDSGAATSIINMFNYNYFFVNRKLNTTNQELRGVLINLMKVMGEFKVLVTQNGKSDNLNLIVVENKLNHPSVRSHLAHSFMASLET